MIVAALGDYGKPRLAVIVQTDAFPQKIGRLDHQDMVRLGTALALVLGLAD